ncbi:MAG: thioredoxin family protein [bacterium]|nr:thioredoxin family protein [bacterium]
MNSFMLIKKAILGLSLVIIATSSCKIPKSYIQTQNGSDQILNGSVQKDVLFDAKTFPWFNYGYKTYEMDTLTLSQIKHQADSLQILAIGGTWCADTQKELPRFLKICNFLKIKNERIELMMVDEKKQCAFFNVKVINLISVPTFIVLKNGKEIGRIVESPEESLEKHLVKIIGLH